MKSLKIYCLILLLLVASLTTSSFAEELAEDYCQVDNFPQSIRQTIVLVDENVVTKQSGKKIPTDNLKLIHLVRKFVDPESSQSNNTFLPREPVRIFTLPRDGSAPLLVFSGCEPFFSKQEQAVIRASKSKWANMKDRYFGSGVLDKSKSYGEKFLRGVGRALKNIGKTTTVEQPVGSVPKSALLSLQSASRLINLQYGIPRVVFISDFSFFNDNNNSKEDTALRRAGFNMAKQYRIKFSRAELYAIHMKSNQLNSKLKNLAESFFLGSEALLVGWSNNAVSNLLTNPKNMNVFQGTINYGSTAPPVRLRLAWDQNGSLVNSWISVSLKYPISTPIEGVLLCSAPKKCTVNSDDSGFAQIWSDNQNDEPEYDPNIPFSGLRRIQINISDNLATGKIWDPAVDCIGGQRNTNGRCINGLKNLPFDLKLIKKGVF